MRFDSLYEKPVLFALAAAVVISVGTLVTTFIPLFLPSTQPVSPLITPYTAVETEGRDIYIREGCNNCHTQTVRPLRTEVARYGDYSRPEESAWDRPFLWGSRRTGPDLARAGGKYPDAWHYRHMANPQGMFATSNMPAYPGLGEAKLDTSLTARKVKILGYGYDEAEVARQLAILPADGHGADLPVRAGALPGDAGRPSGGDHRARRDGCVSPEAGAGPESGAENRRGARDRRGGGVEEPVRGKPRGRRGWREDLQGELPELPR